MQAYIPKPNEANTHLSSEQLFDSYAVNAVQVSDIGRWLRAGWMDLVANPKASLLYGVLFAVSGILVDIVMYQDPVFVAASTTGFLLVAPFLAVGLYEISRQLEQNNKISFFQSTYAIRHNAVSFGIYALLLGSLMAFWIRLAATVTGLFFNNVAVEQQSFYGFWQSMLDMPQGLSFLLAFVAVGLLFAQVSFITSVVTPQLMLDKPVDIVTAISTSVRAVLKNPLTFIAWALVVTAITGLGLMVFNLGLIITMPWLGHASWHLYRAVVTTHKAQ